MASRVSSRLIWRLALPYVALVLAATLGLTLFISGQVREVQLADLEGQLLADARLLAGNVAHLIQDGATPAQIDALAHAWAERLEARVTVIGADGVVLGESHTDRTQMDNHLDRTEVQRALRSGQGSSMRFSSTMGFEMMYAATPIITGSEEADPLGVMRVALPLGEIEANVGHLRHTITAAGLGVALVAGLLAVVIAGRTTHPVVQLTAVAQRMANGDLDARLHPSGRDEVGQLTRAFNHMADRIRDQVSTLAEERARLAAVLDHMADGVLITDRLGEVRLANAAAARLLETTEELALGRSFAQVARYHPLIDLWRQCRELGEEQVEMVEVSRRGLLLQAIVTPFGYGSDGESEMVVHGNAEGYLIILQDLTRIRRLETVRRDFISNISHELRTPLAGLKALVDTLRGGAIKDRPAAKRFLKRMDAEVDSMTQLVEELLDLSRIESGQAPLHLAPAAVTDVIIPPVDRLAPQAERSGLDLSVSVPHHLPRILADVEQARLVLTNLVHNAVKFTPPGGRIVVSARESGAEIEFSVQDTGVGIAAEDLPRVFERFFKADKARSGGGTGLGLAIAKHVVQGHGGRLWAESVEGTGSTFFFTLPVALEE